MAGEENTDRFAAARRRMVTCDLMGRGMTDSEVLKVMGLIRREEFILEKYRRDAYADFPLPIGFGQTISQPYIVALMTEELKVNANCEVLEIGTGCGYQTAVLSKLAKKVYTIEKFSQLAESAQAVLGRLGAGNVEFYVGDGSCGWPDGKSFDRIMVTAGVPEIPKPLIKQLKNTGLLVGPVGSQLAQQLMVCEKKNEKITERVICDVRFVKLIGKYGFEQ